jgi:DNA repair photolyase
MIRQATLPLLFVLSPTLQPDPGASLARRLRKAALRRQPVVVGTVAAPYEPAAGRREEDPLRQSLLPAEGLEIAITTATPRILRQLDLLVELDRRHSVAVRMILPASADDPEPWMRAVRGLTAEGIATSVLLSPAAPGRRSSEETFRFLLEGALAAGAVDVEIDLHSLHRGSRLPLLDAFRRLRLEYGFPHRAAGRG